MYICYIFLVTTNFAVHSCPRVNADCRDSKEFLEHGERTTTDSLLKLNDHMICNFFVFDFYFKTTIII